MSTRRKFIKDAMGVTILACCGVGMSALLDGCSSPRYVSSTKNANKLSVNKAEFGEDKFVIVDNSEMEAPIFLYRKEQDEFLALLMLCTHKACDVKPAGSILICPCHGSEFSREGKVLKGPADEPLVSFPVSTDADHIHIHLKG